MGKILIYVHGMGGSPEEIGHYRPLFPGFSFFAPEYTTIDPADGGKEIGEAVKKATIDCEEAVLVANSIGAFLTMHAGIGALLSRAYFISPVVDMEALIANGLQSVGLTEEDLRRKGRIHTPDGTELSWVYLCRLRAHPAVWDTPTEILCGGKDRLTSVGTMRAFAEKHAARLTVMEEGGHWFHTEEQMAFLDAWIRRGEDKER